jgi:hypothetical protein
MWSAGQELKVEAAGTKREATKWEARAKTESRSGSSKTKDYMKGGTLPQQKRA